METLHINQVVKLALSLISSLFFCSSPEDCTRRQCWYKSVGYRLHENNEFGAAWKVRWFKLPWFRVNGFLCFRFRDELWERCETL